MSEIKPLEGLGIPQTVQELGEIVRGAEAASPLPAVSRIREARFLLHAAEVGIQGLHAELDAGLLALQELQQVQQGDQKLIIQMNDLLKGAILIAGVKAIEVTFKQGTFLSPTCRKFSEEFPDYIRLPASRIPEAYTRTYGGSFPDRLILPPPYEFISDHHGSTARARLMASFPCVLFEAISNVRGVRQPCLAVILHQPWLMNPIYFGVQEVHSIRLSEAENYTGYRTEIKNAEGREFFELTSWPPYEEHIEIFRKQYREFMVS